MPPLFHETLSDVFPGSLPEPAYVGASYQALFNLGFDSQNSLVCVSVCRDELTHPLVAKIASAWGQAFNFSSLAGMLWLGRTGVGAALAHAPTPRDGRSRFCFYAMPHIGIDRRGELGFCHRDGQAAVSQACGALWAAMDALADGDGARHHPLDPDDIEQSLLCRALADARSPGSPKDLLSLTHLTRRVMQGALEHLIELCVDAERADYAVLTGIQVHGPDGRDFVFPCDSYAVVSGRRASLPIGAPTGERGD